MSLDSLVEAAVIADLALDASLSPYPAAAHDSSDDVSSEKVRISVTATDQGDFYPGSGFKRVHVEVELRVNQKATGVPEGLLDTLADRVDARLQPSSTIAGVVNREPAFSNASVSVRMIQASTPNPRADEGLVRQRTIARFFVAAQLA